MLGEALSLLEQADRLQRQFFRLASAEGQVWEPPIDIVETADSLIVHVALPGVTADSITIGMEADAVTVSALRPSSDGLRPATGLGTACDPAGIPRGLLRSPVRKLRLKS